MIMKFLHLTIFDKERFTNENLPSLPSVKIETNNAFFVKDKKFFNEFSPSSSQSKQKVSNVV